MANSGAATGNTPTWPTIPMLQELHVAGVAESDLNLSVERLIDSLDDTQRPLLTPSSPGSSSM